MSGVAEELPAMDSYPSGASDMLDLDHYVQHASKHIWKGDVIQYHICFIIFVLAYAYVLFLYYVLLVI